MLQCGVLIEGKNQVAECIESGATIDKIMMYKGTTDNAFVARIKQSGIMYQFVDKSVLDRVSKTNNHQGFIAFVTNYQYYTLDDIIEKAYKKGSQPLILILDGVEDPHNFGNIVRTAECMGVDGIIIPKNRSVSVNETVVRVSAGATSHIQISKVVNINHEIEVLKEKGFWIFAAEAGGMEVSQMNMNGPIAIVMGGENTGVHHHTRELCDAKISITMQGKINSLNVANACAMILYEVNRQRNSK
jgi:23S rRNA (guanosine2251-2'-O)-methyltransferase